MFSEPKHSAFAIFLTSRKSIKKDSPWLSFLERVKGIEPSYPAWEADVLPMNYTRME